ncbi:MAG: type 2 isopentenyl-diphosphate Delta-isomerase [Candidatus Marsarchaeota archaeon]|nr:type 2 isopentenyl-diphosphate Delta-isomerase [Candidatus Marsarchaeota archaeon]
MADPTSSRKLEHINISLNKDVQFKATNQFENVLLFPKKSKRTAQPEADISTLFLGKKTGAPIFISAMTGGHEKTFQINKNLAEAADEFNIPMGLGSQRAMIEHSNLAYTYDVKKYYDIILLGNIGIAQLANYRPSQIERMLDDVRADALCVHTNPAQEIAQPEGNLGFKNAFANLKSLAEVIDYKVIVKEVGNGISKEVAEKIGRTKVYGIDTGGAGGTNWIAIELFRNSSHDMDFIKEWGIPTAQSLIEIKSVFKRFVTATGGIRTGSDVVKAIALGADSCGIAMPMLKANKNGSKGIKQHLAKLIEEIKYEMALLNCASIDDLKSLKFAINDPLSNILKQRNINMHYSR